MGLSSWSSWHPLAIASFLSEGPAPHPPTAALLQLIQLTKLLLGEVRMWELGQEAADHGQSFYLALDPPRAWGQLGYIPYQAASLQAEEFLLQTRPIPGTVCG